MEYAVADESLPDDNTPLTPLAYMQESMTVWREFSKRTTTLMLGQASKIAAPEKTDPEDVETLASEFLRTMADMNLQHWQNTARLLDGLPSWMKAPSNMTGAAMVDWFDNMRRRNGAFAYPHDRTPVKTASASLSIQQPKALKTPDGQPDDLTRIKGIGSKLSALLNELGVFHFRQIAGWSEPEAAWVDDYLAFKGRVARENWIEQARGFAANGSATLH